jgi:hypothetical protein
MHPLLKDNKTQLNQIKFGLKEIYMYNLQLQILFMLFHQTYKRKELFG